MVPAACDTIVAICIYCMVQCGGKPQMKQLIATEGWAWGPHRQEPQETAVWMPPLSLC